MLALFTAFLTKALILAACHFLGDYAFQFDWMAKLKGKDWHALYAHAGTYTCFFAILLLVPQLSMSPWAVIFIFVSHMLIDPLKARWGKISLAMDQTLHFLVLGFILLNGWI